MSKESQIAHFTKYLNYAETIGANFDNSKMLPGCINALKRGDILFNSMPLRQWDSYHYVYKTLADMGGLERPGGWSMNNTVCTAKVAALKSALQALGYPADSAEQIYESIQTMQFKSKV